MIFTDLFYKHIMFRHSCGKCHFCNTTRPSDITLADFWGWEKTDPNINKDDKGVSLVLVNKPKGREIFEAVKDKLDTIPTELANCLQPNLQHPTILHDYTEKFRLDYINKGFDFVIWRYGDNYPITRFKRICVNIKNKACRIIRKLLSNGKNI